MPCKVPIETHWLSRGLRQDVLIVVIVCNLKKNTSCITTPLVLIHSLLMIARLSCIEKVYDTGIPKAHTIKTPLPRPGTIGCML